MRKFLEALETELNNSNIDCNGIGINAENSTLFALRIEGSGKNRHTERLNFYSNPYHKHQFIIDEEWMKKEADGSPWSDNMGGIVVDCTGLTRAEAVNKIVNKTMEHFAQWFSK